MEHLSDFLSGIFLSIILFFHPVPQVISQYALETKHQEPAQVVVATTTKAIDKQNNYQNAYSGAIDNVYPHWENLNNVPVVSCGNCESQKVITHLKNTTSGGTLRMLQYPYYRDTDSVYYVFSNQPPVGGDLADVLLKLPVSNVDDFKILSEDPLRENKGNISYATDGKQVFIEGTGFSSLNPHSFRFIKTYCYRGDGGAGYSMSLFASNNGYYKVEIHGEEGSINTVTVSPFEDIKTIKKIESSNYESCAP